MAQINKDEWRRFKCVRRYCIYQHDTTEQWMFRVTLSGATIVWTKDFSEYLKGQYDMLVDQYGDDDELFEEKFIEWYLSYEEHF